MNRLYFAMTVILSVIFVVGGITISKYLNAKPYLVILLLLVPYFMCTTGTMYHIFSVPHELALSSEGKLYDMYYVHDQESKSHDQPYATAPGGYLGRIPNSWWAICNHCCWPRVSYDHGRPDAKRYLFTANRAQECEEDD